MKSFLFSLLLLLSSIRGYSQEVQDSISAAIVNVNASGIDSGLMMGLFFTLPFILLICHIVGTLFCVKKMFYVLWGTFLTLCVFECFLLTILSSSFSQYAESQQGWSILRFILLVGFTGVMQVLSFFKIMDNIKQYHQTDFSLSMGFWAFGIGLVLSVILGMIWGEELFIISLMLTFLTQPAQAIYIFIMVLKKSGIFVALLAAITYLIGFTLTIAAALVCMIAYLLFKLVSLFFSSSSSSSDDDSDDRRRREFEANAWYADQEYRKRRGF